MIKEKTGQYIYTNDLTKFINKIEFDNSDKSVLISIELIIITIKAVIFLIR